MSKKKIFNDPIYGLIDFPHDIIYELIDHPYFQRLRRISQLGYTSIVYPGATNTRFPHALGACFLMTRAIKTLKSKGVDISYEEEIGVCITILLHDIGHGPYSHALEGQLLPMHHEDITLAIMDELNEGKFKGKLDLAIKIFKKEYHKPFLYELVSSQLDMDRMDYLMRDTYYTGVAEGVIGYDRLIKMLNVVNGHLAIEEKGLHSVEKFILARRLMYQQVYLHKTALSAERMLRAFFARLIYLINQELNIITTPSIKNLIQSILSDKKNVNLQYQISEFVKCDDADILYTIKANQQGNDKFLSYICRCLLNRILFKVRIFDGDVPDKIVSARVDQLMQVFGLEEDISRDLSLKVFSGDQNFYSHDDEIRILKKDGSESKLSDLSEINFNYGSKKKSFLFEPIFI